EIIGPIRQEVLSGVRSDTQLDSLQEAMGLFPEIRIPSEDYDTAAKFYNLCRRRGIQGSGTDFLICAVTAREDIPIFTIDQDFESYAEILPVALHRSSARSWSQVHRTP
ncbi:MAG: PIN domain-containing protein, partial [Verrucomicrobiota bacterium]